MKILLSSILVIQLLASCSNNADSTYFDFFLNEPCMIVNEEQDNLIEGKYLFVNKIIIKDSSIVLNMPSDFYVNNSNCNKWILG